MDQDFEKENLTFHYKRQERLSEAPAVVKKAYSGELPQPPQGLFKALVHTKGSKFMLIALVFTLALTAGILMFGSQEHAVTLNGIKFSMSAFSFNETVYISVKTEAMTEIAETGEVFASFSFRDKDEEEIQTQEITLPYSKIGDFIRTTIRDYDILSVWCTIAAGAESETIKCTVEQK